MRTLTILCIWALFLAGCGQKGPLYHAQPAPEKNQPESPTNKSTTDQKKESH